jgi:hypothetical protein
MPGQATKPPASGERAGIQRADAGLSGPKKLELHHYMRLTRSDVPFYLVPKLENHVLPRTAVIVGGIRRLAAY